MLNLVANNTNKMLQSLLNEMLKNLFKTNMNLDLKNVTKTREKDSFEIHLEKKLTEKTFIHFHHFVLRNLLFMPSMESML